MAKKQQQIDLSIFEHTTLEKNKCDAWNTKTPIEACDILQRLMLAMKYYSLLDITNNDDHQHIFINFVKTVYPELLDHYHHLINVHKTNLEAINKNVIENKQYGECDITRCNFSARHHGTAKRQNTNKESDEILNFYVSTMDSLHFYIYHLFECGLRINKDNNVEKKSDDNDTEYYDGEFLRVKQLVNERRHATEAFARFNNNEKFSIAIMDQNDNTSTTFIDEMYKYLLSNQNTETIEESNLVKLRKYIDDEQFDTDSVKMDVSDVSKGNISIYVDKIFDFIQAQLVCSSSFKIGYTFYYWSYYKDMDGFDHNRYVNHHDHGGHLIKDLFIPPKYSTFKEEFSNYKYFSIKDYTDIAAPKIKEYENTKIVRKFKAKTEFDDNLYKFVKLKYEIVNGAALSKEHLLSVILYTDFTDLSRSFSESFRQLNNFEPLEITKSRNSNYYWMSRRLRETVQIYGNYSGAIKGGSLYGPFFSGLSFVAVFPESEIRLCSPSSTSKQIAVAIRFGGAKGVVVELLNCNACHYFLRGFDCSWLSQFKEEDETLFFGGHYRVKIMSVRIMETHRNYKAFIDALSKFSKQFNGEYVHKNNVKRNELSVLKRLFSWKLGRIGKDNKIHEYIYKTFAAYCQNKKSIVFRYSFLYRWHCQEFKDMVLYEIKIGDFTPSIDSKANLFRKELFLLFPNIQTIVVYASGFLGDPKDDFRMSLLSLLSEIENMSFNQIIIKVRDNFFYGASWISSLWKSSSDELIKVFNKNQYKISFKTMKNASDESEDCIVIQNEKR